MQATPSSRHELHSPDERNPTPVRATTLQAAQREECKLSRGARCNRGTKQYRPDQCGKSATPSRGEVPTGLAFFRGTKPHPGERTNLAGSHVGRMQATPSSRHELHSPDERNPTPVRATTLQVAQGEECKQRHRAVTRCILQMNKTPPVNETTLPAAMWEECDP